jgi:hypothetical protein
MGRGRAVEKLNLGDRKHDEATGSVSIWAGGTYYLRRIERDYMPRVYGQSHILAAAASSVIAHGQIRSINIDVHIEWELQSWKCTVQPPRPAMAYNV